jgi:adenosylcobinamide kinase/adenosylcobinamide-phosphate guanylyltransferase
MAGLGKIILFTGGCRSGKSREALRRAVETKGNLVFVATCPRMGQIDAEMDQRIVNHQTERKNFGFRTIEETIDIARAFRSIECDYPKQSKAVVVDCMSLWVNNCIYEAEKNATVLDENEIAFRVQTIARAACEIAGHVFFVTNEVGLGVVPENKLGRLYRDYLGRANQEIALVADEVVFMVSGLPLKLK